MPNLRKPWPLNTTHSLHFHQHRPCDLVLATQLEDGRLLRNVQRMHGRSTFKLCDCDLDEQKFDQELRIQKSSSTISSSCTTLCEISISRMGSKSQAPHLEFPPKRGSRWYRLFRWRLWTPYHRLFTIVFLSNIVLVGWVLGRLLTESTATSTKARPALAKMLTAVSINLTASIVIRNEHIINLLFWMFANPITARFHIRIRRAFAKVYHFGGIHSGGGVAAVFWYGTYTSTAIHDYIESGRPRTASQSANIILTALIWSLMAALLTAAYPRVRARMHNWFEISHRFCGWLILILFWVQTFLFCVSTAHATSLPLGTALVREPVFWTLIIMTCAVLYPWIRLRKVEVMCERLSDHAMRMHIVRADGQAMPSCQVIAISDKPLKETHKFATIPDPNGGPSYSILMSRAGDWTQKIIENPPQMIWVKGAPAWGVLRVAIMFNPVVIVATGAGIGPCLSLFNGFPDREFHVLWLARRPMTTYGQEIWRTIQKAGRTVEIIDTSKQGRQDMVECSMAIYKRARAEAVIVISNIEGTYKAVRELEGRGIPAYGPIWDS